MGLAAVFGTVKHHGGAINVYSEEGEGTTFRIYLPLLGQPAAAPRVRQEVVPAPRPATLLVVDDEQLFRDMARDMLNQAGYDVKTKKNGAAAVKYYRRYAAEIDLVIVDLIMPKLGGRDAYLALREINPDVRVLLASGYSINGEAQALLDQGVLGFLQKPFLASELTAKVAAALQEDRAESD